MKRALKLVLSAIIALSAPALAYAQDYDLVILNGRVMDPETLFDSVANVGIKDARIVAITKDAINGKDSIDVKGLVVAPGFIDTHVHGVDPFLVKLRLRDGVTTAMDLEAGAIRVGEWYAEKAKTGWQVNYGTNASHPCIFGEDRTTHRHLRDAGARIPASGRFAIPALSPNGSSNR